MSLTLKRLVPGQVLTTTPVQVYEAPAGGAILEVVTFSNFDASNATAYVWLLPSGGTLINNYLILTPVTAGATQKASGVSGHVIEGGGTVWMSASVGNVSAMVSGTEVE